MKDLQEMLHDIHLATNAEDTEFKSIQEMIYDIWTCITVDEETGERYLKVHSED